MPLEADEGGADRLILLKEFLFLYVESFVLLIFVRLEGFDDDGFSGSSGAKFSVIVMVGQDAVPPPGDPFPPRDGRQGEGDIGQNVEQVAPFGVDELADAGRLRLAVAAFAPCR